MPAEGPLSPGSERPLPTPNPADRGSCCEGLLSDRFQPFGQGRRPVPSRPTSDHQPLQREPPSRVGNWAFSVSSVVRAASGATPVAGGDIPVTKSLAVTTTLSALEPNARDAADQPV
jgi:hypothetical protein